MVEEVTLEEEEPAFHPFPDAYHSFLVKDPTKSSWSLAPLNGLKTLRITKIRSANKEENEEPFWYYWSGRLKAVSRLWPLGQEPHILPLYGAKRRDKDDVHGVGRRRRSDVQRKVWRDLGSSGYVQVSTCSSRGTYIGVEQRTTGSTKQARSSTASESVRPAEQSDASKDATLLPPPSPPRVFHVGSFFILCYPPDRLVYEKNAAVEQARGRVARTVGRRLLAYFVVPSISGYTTADNGLYGSASELWANIIIRDFLQCDSPRTRAGSNKAKHEPRRDAFVTVQKTNSCENGAKRNNVPLSRLRKYATRHAYGGSVKRYQTWSLLHAGLVDVRANTEGMKASETSVARIYYCFLFTGPCVNPTSLTLDESGGNEMCMYELGIDSATCRFFSST
ncbi:hypothetical protein EV421DRAFT_1742504 [Armillaria borealis]|uniref:Uncharacterized protein n=1 Tax=Armillaria borealis TaxID=47425 RepID=A0AA39MFT7_9AGAR|nr:hypothetical protein EV421DRAFT_1742504 [Armillaria borealis]